MSALNLFFGFSGRINRGKYWLALLVWVLIWIVAGIALLVAAFGILGSNLEDAELPEDPAAVLRLILDYGVLSLIVSAGLILSWVSALAIGIKRLHDRDRSGWWIVLFYFGPGVLGGLQSSTNGGLASAILGLGAFVISIWGLIELGFLRGTRGPNRFGPDPLRPDIAGAPTWEAPKPAA